ncbi:DUF5658 family protein [Rhodopirellula bahusiensis]|uniref:DUF5658 family protein n=1 Tax=Rhodopirellula bahusiensis TaxID=2014065 RepID=UPI001E4029BC|nr:DUF5658 family protein [Rhodopirellula bahusiensis]
MTSHPLLYAIVFAVCFSTNALAQPGNRGSGGLKPLETDQGSLLIDGVYVETPYSIDVSADERSIVINGVSYGADYFDLSQLAQQRGREERGRGMGRGPGGGRRGGGGPRGWDDGFETQNERFRGGPRVNGNVTESDPLEKDALAVRRLLQSLQMLDWGAIHVLDQGQPPWQLWHDQSGHELLEALIAKSKGEAYSTDVPKQAASSGYDERWASTIVNFEPSPSFRDRAEQAVALVNEAEAQNASVQAANLLIARLNYPMTMLALVLVVFAVGHLMAEASQIFSSTEEPTDTPNVRKKLVISLVIIGLMSGIDLAWTLIAHQSGTMRELNPVGSRLIENPYTLAVFKILITSMSLALLFYLRQKPLARKATWWCCLVLTLLTARWLTFQSLFA